MSSNPYAAPSTDAAGPDRFVSQGDRVRLLSTLLLVSVATDVVLVVSNAVTLHIFVEAKAGRLLDEAQADAVDLRGFVVFGLYLVTLIVTAVVFAKFLMQANRNVRAMGHPPLGYSPGSMVWWYFVPIANLFKPYAAVREVWFASTTRPSSPEPTWDTLKLWWATWVISSILNNISFRMTMKSEDIDTYITSTVLDIVASVVEIGAALTARKWIAALDAAQESEWAEQRGNASA